MSKETHKILTSSENPNWISPHMLMNRLREEFFLCLDAAATDQDRQALQWLGPGSPLGEDALQVNWQVASLGVEFRESNRPKAIWINPPYDKKHPIGPWLFKMALEGCSGPLPVIGCIPYSPQTKAWRTFVMGQNSELKATEVRLFPYRLKFEAPEGHEGSVSGANVNTAIVIWKSTKGFVEPWSPAFRYWSYR